MTHLEEQILRLRETLTEMAKLVASQLQKSIACLFERDEDLANEVIFTEKRVNAFELNIDRDCERIFTLFAPVAQDMRFVFSTLKINADLERIGDYADGIAKLALLGLQDFDPALIAEYRMKEMYEIAYEMITDIATAYFEGDTKLARTVYTSDIKLNEINHNATAITVRYCRDNPQKIQQALYLLSIVHKLERVGDHITNIAEDIIFYKEAVVLKHADKQMDRE